MSEIGPIVHLDLEPDWRGGQRQVWWLVQALSELGLSQVAVVRKAAPLAQRLHGLPGVRVIEASNRWQAWRRMPRPPGAIIHAHSGNTIPLAVAARGRGRRAVVTRRVANTPRRLPLAWADAVVAISPHVADVVAAAGVAATRIYVIPSAIDLKRRADAGRRAELRAKIGVPHSAPLGLTVAALTPEKDPTTLVRALALLPDTIHHVWIGTGPELAAVRALAAQLGVASRLHLPGFIPDPDDWYAAADWFVLASRHEGLGSVLLDAFHFGLPVVAASIPGARELLVPQRALTYTPGDAAELAAAIQELRRDPAATAARIEAARMHVAAYGIAATAASYVRLYQELAEHKGTVTQAESS